MLLLIADKRSILQLKYKIQDKWWNCQCEYSTNTTLNEAAPYKWIRQTVNNHEWWWWWWKQYSNSLQGLPSAHASEAVHHEYVLNHHQSRFHSEPGRNADFAPTSNQVQSMKSFTSHSCYVSLSNFEQADLLASKTIHNDNYQIIQILCDAKWRGW